MADTIKLFGRAYNQIGSTDADTIIKTKGQIKIQYGNKFIDLIKNGKLNINAEFIFKAKSINDITGNDGIYILDDGSVYLKVSDSVINLLGKVGTTYVSFLEEQETTAEQKHQALVNIGFLHENLDSIGDTSLQNGIVYIESEQKLYTIVNGTVTELVVTFPNPFTSQFVIAKTNSDKGAILIKGTGIENSLAFETLFIYVKDEATNFDSDNTIIYSIGGTQVLSMSMLSALFNIPVQGSMFQSPDANNKTGFRLYIQNEKSYLEVDNIIVRNQEDDPSSIHLFPEYWLMKNNIISSATMSSKDETEPEGLSIELVQSNEFVVGDIVIFYKKSVKQVSLGMVEVEIYDEEGNVIGTKQEEQFQEIETYSRVEGEILKIQDKTLTVKCNSEINEAEADALSRQFIYLIKSKDAALPIRIKDNNIDIVEYSDEKDENGYSIPSIKTRIGNLEQLDKNVQKNETEAEKVQSYGIYSEQAIFGIAKLLAETTIPYDDNSSTLAPTSWVRKLLSNLVPSGTITAFHGAIIPDGWIACDGENGTPDLRDKFIKGGTTEEASSIEGVLVDTTQTNITSIDCYSLVFIMKL